MLGKLRTVCLRKYVLFSGEMPRFAVGLLHRSALYTGYHMDLRHFGLDYDPSLVHNSKDTRETSSPRKADGIRLTSAYASSAGPTGPRRCPPPSPGRDRSALSGHCV